MMEARAVKVSNNKHDQDLLEAGNVLPFKKWLKDQGVEVREPSSAHRDKGVYFWVVPVSGKAKPKVVSVQEGIGRNKRYAQTHFRLRPLIGRFLTAPLVSAVREAAIPSVIQPECKGDKAPLVLPAAPQGDAGRILGGHQAEKLVSAHPSAPLQGDKQAAPRKLSQDLIDLRDDFAITCPLVQKEGESVTAFADRRWEYAQAMIDARPK